MSVLETEALASGTVTVMVAVVCAPESLLAGGRATWGQGPVSSQGRLTANAPLRVVRDCCGAWLREACSEGAQGRWALVEMRLSEQNHLAKRIPQVVLQPLLLHDDAGKLVKHMMFIATHAMD